MKVFLPIGEEGCELAQPEKDEDFETINVQVHGKSRGASWNVFRMKLFSADEQGKQLQPSDAPWFGSHALIFKPRAVRELLPLLADHVEFLSVVCAGAELVIANPPHLADALDENSSALHRFERSGRVFRIDRYVFLPDRVRDMTIFKITSLRVSPTFVWTHLWPVGERQVFVDCGFSRYGRTTEEGAR